MKNQDKYKLKKVEVKIRIAFKNKDAKLMAKSLFPDEIFCSKAESSIFSSSKYVFYIDKCHSNHRCINKIRSVVDDFLRCLKVLTSLVNEKVI